ncbi:MAG: MvaI/BcnI restriction endonuclease family protein [Saprospiraceae bacterium]|nr:MvaI/BcnI restriction endonuclease family protein [Saprospiraceae bacterium]
MNLTNLIKLYSDKGCNKVYVKTLAANDNSKNQVYLGGNFEVLNIFPIRNITQEDVGDWSRERFKTGLDFFWIDEDGQTYPAPYSQLILYPKYPEVRFSGFLKGCKNAPSDLMANRIVNRLLFFGVDNDGKILGYVTSPGSALAKEFNSTPNLEIEGVFRVFNIQKGKLQRDSKDQLLGELKRIHNKGWIKSKRLGSDKGILPCESSNCGGYTLEAELGITPNGYSEPDFLGWEVKQFGVANFSSLKNAVITLMTPEPTSGFYVSQGVEAFIRKFGYIDKRGREDRMNFGGIYKAGKFHPATKLTLNVRGFNAETGIMTDPTGSIALITENEVEAATWSFSSLLKHWNKKHAKASYVPSRTQKEPARSYSYGGQIILGTGTDFTLFLKQMALGNIYYDPGIKLENMSTKPKTKRRSQFRIKSLYLPELYRINEIVDLIKE